MTAPRRKRTRLPGYDYSTAGCYFVTINARSRAPWFGSVANGVVHLNGAGDMVLRVWESLPERFPGTMLDAFIVMPDHLHGIIVLGSDPLFPEVPRLSDVVGAFKSLTAIAYGRGVRLEGWRPYDQHLWHRSFRDTIISTERSLDSIQDYIESNPGRWSEKNET